MRQPDQRGVTLIELMAVVAILSILFGIVGIGLTASDPPESDARVRRLRAGRKAAITTGVDVLVMAEDSTSVVRFRPDGQAVGGGVDPLNGATIGAERE